MISNWKKIVFCETQWRHSVKTELYNTPPHTSFCETRWRQSVKTRLYNTPPPYFILWNAVTSVGENKVI